MLFILSAPTVSQKKHSVAAIWNKTAWNLIKNRLKTKKGAKKEPFQQDFDEKADFLR
ncbi:hypothetical protein [Hydrogeniiclostridium mannosilyticum]|uniref:hypothetical protein n=1 Tax=Hydrogeniiclostridium mannosilyticum TaxID=2764322 RepID=UPI00399B0346